jgi:AbrB family looped-hinge helix DNA binding protein
VAPGYYLITRYYSEANAMSTSRLTSKGQATIPADVRAALGLKPGDSVEFRLNDAGEMVLRRAPTLADLCGILKVAPEVAADLRGKSWDDLRAEIWDDIAEIRLGRRD